MLSSKKFQNDVQYGYINYIFIIYGSVKETWTEEY